jgi:HEAT repeat protein
MERRKGRALSAQELGAEDAVVAERAAEAMRDLGQYLPPSWVAAVLDTRSGWSDYRVVVPTYWLGAADVVIKWFNQLLHDSSWRVRLLAVVGLGAVHDVSAKTIRQQAQEDQNANVRRAGASMLSRWDDAAADGALSDEGPWTELLDLIFVAGNDVQLVISEWLHERNGIDALGSEVERFISTVQSLRPALTGNDMVLRLEALLDWPTWEVRARAATALGGLKATLSDTAIQRLLELRRRAEGTPEWASAAFDAALGQCLPSIE